MIEGFVNIAHLFAGVKNCDVHKFQTLVSSLICLNPSSKNCPELHVLFCHVVLRVSSNPPSDGLSVRSIQGMLYNPVSGAWSWTDSTAINYALHALRVTDQDGQPEEAEEAREEKEEERRG